jgi:hypothetical protein
MISKLLISLILVSLKHQEVLLISANRKSTAPIIAQLMDTALEENVIVYQDLEELIAFLNAREINISIP